MKLFLTSYAMYTLDTIASFLPKTPDTYSVIFIPTAANMYDDAPWIRTDRDKLLELGFTVSYFDIEGSNEKEVKEVLAANDIIFVAGGNTFFLLEHAQKSGFEKIVKEAVFKEKIYIGSSAGSVIAGPDIEAVKYFDDPDEAELDNTKGFGLVDFVVLPHFHQSDPSFTAVEKEYEGKYTFIPLTNEQMVVVADKKYQIV